MDAATRTHVRIADADDAEAISALTMASMQRHIAADCSEGGGRQLLASMQPEPTRERLRGGHRYWVAENALTMGAAEGRRSAGAPVLLGVIAIRLPRHLYHLFVADDAQRQGLARRLWATARAGIADQPPGDITVNASRNAVTVYARLGFVAVAAERTVDGIPSTPMRFVGGAG